MDNTKFTLVGWPGICIDNKRDQEILHKKLRDHFFMEPIFLDNDVITSLVDPCYTGIINPLLMNFINLEDRDIEIQERWDILLRFSDHYSQEVGKLIKRTSYILFLDHYMILVPKFMRKLYTVRQTSCALGLYLNYTFPSYSVLKLFPFSEDIVESMLSLDVIVFLSFEHVDGFVQMVRSSKKVNYKVEKGVMCVTNNGKSTIIRIGGIIAFNAVINELLRTVSFQQNYNRLKQEFEDRYVIVSFDPLSSYIGVELRLQSLAEFVQRHCQKGRPIHYIQIINDEVPWVKFSEKANRTIETYKNMFADMPQVSNLKCELVLTTNISEDTLFGYLKIANLFMNTRLSSSSDPLMVNYFLVNEDGFVLMSDFSAFDRYASRMLKINPYNKHSLFAGMIKIFKASGYFSAKDLENEKNRNPKVIESVNPQTWLESLLSDMSMVQKVRKEANTLHSLDYFGRQSYKLDSAKLKTSFKSAKKVLIILGLEGLLTCEDKGELIVTNDGKTVRVPPKVNKELIKQLEPIARDNRVNMFIITSKGLEDVKQIIGEHTHIGMAAEKGYYFKMPGDPSKCKWEHICDFNESWKTVAMNIMKQYERKIMGSLTEYSNTGVVWTFDINADEITYRQAQALKENLQKTLSNYQSIEVLSGDGFVEVRHHVISKATFMEILIRYIQQDGVNIDLIVALSGVNTEDSLFSCLNNLTSTQRLLTPCTELYCIAVGNKNPHAKYFVSCKLELEFMIKELRSCVVSVNMPKPGSFTS